MDKKNFYITTTLPYVNAAPHIGFALEIVQADAIARWKALEGHDVIFNTGTDEHGLKIYQKALEEGKDPKAYTDEYAPKFDRLKSALNLSYTNFIRTTDAHHVSAAQEFWKRCALNGDIYKKTYRVKYCVGCELEKTDSELENGKCAIHPNLEIEHIEEENYFFKFSRYQDALLEYYAENQNFVIPSHRLKEIRTFVERGLQDFSISRLKEKMPWGVPVPGDDSQVMYVWFDALVNYVSTLGWPEQGENFENFWGTRELPNAIQIAGKDNLRQQSAMWQAMLLSAGLPPSKQILIHGFITSGGQKMSKSLGNVIDPFEIVEKHGTDALRYWLLRDMPTFEDGDFTWERFTESYNANLANGLGNLVSRVTKMARNYGIALEKNHEAIRGMESYRDAMEKYEFQKAMNAVWERIQISDKFIQETEPFKTIKKDPEKAQRDVKELLESVWEIGTLLAPFLPETSLNIRRIIEDPSFPIPVLFPRIV
jgi:methionyl-tRNA synthetase